MEFYSAIRNKDNMWFEGKWMPWEDIMLSELSQAQKDKGHVFLLYLVDPKDNHIHKNKTILYKLICRICLQQWNYSMELKERGKGKESDRASTIE
jgi:hypothetical protein